MTHDITVYAEWCNDGTADLSVMCNCGAVILAAEGGYAAGASLDAINTAAQQHLTGART